MTEERHQDLKRANIPKLNITDWAVLSTQDMKSLEPLDISPRSRDKRNDDISADLSRPNPILPSSAGANVNSNKTSPIPTSKLIQIEQISSPAWLVEIRKVIQEEGHALIIEGIKKLAQFSETQSIGSISSAAGSVVSTSSLDQSHNNVPGATTSETPVDETTANRRTVRFSDRQVFPIHPSGGIRPTSNSQPSADWGQLFDENGYATLRLGHVLRGIAKHIIDDYTPKNSIVITPEKLANFYMKYQLEREVHPFTDLFSTKAGDANEPLADFYDDLECQHHLVQKDCHSKPSVPALTPIGFAQYLTICILAYPDEEFRRLEKIIAETTLIADTITRNGQPERLPKTIFRSCLPVRYDLKNRKLLDSAIDDLMYDLSLQHSDSRMAHYTVSSSEEKGNPNAGHDIIDHAQQLSQRPNITGEDQLVLEYDARGARKRFTPGTLQTIGDESVVENYDGSQCRDLHPEKNHKRVENASTTTVKNDSANLPSEYNQYLTSSPMILQRPSLPGSGARSQSYSHPRAYFSTIIPPPPIGPHASVASNLGSTPRRLRSPQRRGHSASVPNVSTGIGSPSSSTTIFTPSSYSSDSVSPTTENGALANLPKHYQKCHRDLHDHPTYQAVSMTKHDDQHHYRHRSNSNLEITGACPHNNDSDIQKITSGGGIEQADASWAGTSPNLEWRLERRPSQRHRYSAPSVESVSDADEHGLTWGEYLKGQQERSSEKNQNRAIGYLGER